MHHLSKIIPFFTFSNFHICKFDTISSTQDELKNILKKIGKIPEFSVISAGFQTAGKGRMNRKWLAEKNQNALFSFVTYPGMHVNRLELLYQQAAVAIISALVHYADIRPVIKYPNDILVQGRKLAGILIDTAIHKNKIEHAVIGMGVNINQTKFDRSLHAVSLLEITGKKNNPATWIERIVNQYIGISKLPPETIFETYVYFWNQAGKKKGIISGDTKIAGEIKAIRNDRIFLKTKTGILSFPVKEVKAWV